MYRQLLLLTLLATLNLCRCEKAANNDSHDMEWGKRQTGDKLLYSDIVYRPFKYLRVVEADVVYPDEAAAFGSQPTNITYIKAKDQYTNGNGGYASVIAGGIGKSKTIVHFKSQRGHGFNFILEIYGI